MEHQETLEEFENRLIAWIDKASYEELAEKYQTDPWGSPYFLGRVGIHYLQVMNKRGEEVT